MEQEVERWLPWPVNEKIMVSSFGRVKSFRESDEGKELPLIIRSDGYVKVSLIDDSKQVYEKGRWTNLFLHRLVAITFLENPDNLPEVNHLDRVKSNCRIDNLEWITHQNNIIHSFLTREMPTGKDHWNHGKKYGKEQCKAMSDQKIGERHPKFIGWYMKDGIKYSAATTAAKETGVDHRSVKRYAKSNTKGWSFIPKITVVDNSSVTLDVTNE